MTIGFPRGNKAIPCNPRGTIRLDIERSSRPLFGVLKGNGTTFLPFDSLYDAFLLVTCPPSLGDFFQSLTGN